MYRPPALLQPYVESYVGYRYAGFARRRAHGAAVAPPHVRRHLRRAARAEPAARWARGADVASTHCSAASTRARPRSVTTATSTASSSRSRRPARARCSGCPPRSWPAWSSRSTRSWGRLGGELLDRLDAAAGLAGALRRARSRAAARARRRGWSCRRVLAARRGGVGAADRDGGQVEVAALAGGGRLEPPAPRPSDSRAEYGLGPKAMARVLRFETGTLDAGRSPAAALADVAAACGYADQAHLTREWHALAGCQPDGVDGGGGAPNSFKTACPTPES